MKAAPFRYERAGSLAEACALLARHGPDAKPIAGGQSLVPMMAMRLARPACLVDLNGATDLQEINAQDDHLHLGAVVRQARLERDSRVRAQVPLLVKALPWVGHVQTRNRGTVGGSMVHADPSAEIPLVAVTLGARLRLASEEGETWLDAGEFFLAPMVTAIGPDQCLAELAFPVWREPRVGSSFHEVSIRHGDFALASACAQVALDEDGRCTRAALGIGGAGAVPIAVSEVAAALAGKALDETTVAEAAHAAALSVDPEADLHASAEYRRHLAGVLAAAALRAARDEALARMTS
jgi:aerobic carbon-monoxide dehydrogenase medium subunit